MMANMPTFICALRDRLRRRCRPPRVSAGVYAAQGTIRYVVLRLAGETRTVCETGSVACETSASFAECLGRCLGQITKRMGHAGFSFSLGFSNDTLRVLPVELPPLSREDAKKAFAFELSRHFPFEPQEAVYDVLPTGCSCPEGGLSVWMAAAMPLSLAQEAIEASDAAGVRLKAIEPTAFAIRRYVEGADPLATPARMHLLAHGESAFAIGMNAGRMGYFRAASASWESRVDSLAASVRSFKKLLREESPLELTLSVSSIEEQEVLALKQALESVLNLRVEVRDPWRAWGLSDPGMGAASKEDCEIPAALALR